MNRKVKNVVNIDSLLKKAKKYYKFTKDELQNIQTEKGFIKNKIILNTQKGKVSIKVTSKQFNSFLEQLKLYNP
jgi:hypothetical protein